MLDIKKIMRGFKIFNNATQADSVQLTVPDSYTGNYEFTFPNTGTTTGQQVVTTGATQTLSNKTITLTAVTPNRLLHSDGTGTITATQATYSDSATDVTLNVTTARDFVINGKAVRVPTAAADPAGVQGDIYFNTVGQELRFFNSGGWQSLAASAAANQTLSNLLSPTAINQDLLPDGAIDLGSGADRFTNTFTDTLDVDNITSSTNLQLQATSVLFNIDQASDPGTPAAQQVYYNSTNNDFKYYDGTRWWALAKQGDSLSVEDSGAVERLTISAAPTVSTIDSSVNLEIEAPVINWDIDQASDPGSPAEQQMYYNSTDNRFKYYNGTEWRGIADTSAVAAKYQFNAGSSQTFTPSSFQLVNFDEQVYDTVGGGDISPTWSFTADRDGIYFISASLRFNPSASLTVGNQMILRVKKNTVFEANLCTEVLETTAFVTRFVTGNNSIVLSAGDIVEIDFFHNTGANAVLTTSTDNWVTIEWVGENN